MRKLFLINKMYMYENLVCDEFGYRQVVVTGCRIVILNPKVVLMSTESSRSSNLCPKLGSRNRCTSLTDLHENLNEVIHDGMKHDETNKLLFIETSKLLFNEDENENYTSDNKKKFKVKKLKKGTLRGPLYSATMLDWWHCCTNHLHTDSIAWNKSIRIVNGNKSKVKDFLDVMYQNVPGSLGVVNLSNQLDSIVERIHPDILFVGEADSEDVKAACPEGYIYVGGDLKAKKDLVRVSALVKDNIPFKKIKTNTKIPVVGLKIGEWHLLGVYREWALCGDQSTKSREMQVERLENFVEYWLTIRCKSICIGDFNFDPFPGTEYQRSLESIRTCVNDVVLPTGWRQLIEGITRDEPGQDAALLDHCYVNSVDRCERTWNTNISGGDHNLVGVRIKSRGVIFRAETFEFRDLKTVTEADFAEAWEEGNPSDIFEETNDPSEAVRIWEHKMHLALEKVAPLRRITTRPKHNKWLTKELKEMCDQRDLMRREAKLWKTPESISRYKTYRNLVTNRLKKAKFDWRRDHLTVDDSKKWWGRVKKLAGLSKVKGEDMLIKKDDGSELSKPKELAEFMNGFFKEKVTKLQATLKVDKGAVMEYAREYMHDKGLETPPTFSFETVRTGAVAKVIKKLKNTSAQGRDEISTPIIKQFKGVISSALRHVINLSISKGIYPTPWKTGLITPLPKGGDLSIPKNWRPVCIMPAASKILEGVLQIQLQMHMEEHQIFSPSQHAYRRCRSTESALIELDTIVQKARNEQKVVALLLTDMSAAFNLIKKDVLLSQLEVYGFDKKSREMVGSYLSQRTTKCRVKGCISGEVELDSGVGEGSVLGPGFYICGMCSVNVVAKRVRLEMAEEGFWIDAWTLEFADDTSGLIVANDEAELQVAVHLMMKKFEHYFNSMGMCLNASKSELIVFRSKRKEFTITLPSGQEEAETVKLLGLHIDNDYKFVTHTEKVCQKIRFKLANINRVRPYLGQEKARMITESLVLSTVSYMAIVYLRLHTNQKKIQKMINLAARSVLQAHPRTHVVEMLNELVWLNSTNFYEYLLICALRRMRQGLMKTPVSFNEIFLNKFPGLYRLRSTHLRVQWTKIQSHGRNSFLVNSVNAYNKYDLNSELFLDEDTFKSSMKIRIFGTNVNGNVK